MASSRENWSDFCAGLALSDPSYTHSIRKMVPDVMFKTELDDTILLTNVGFKPNGSKLTMLKKYYMNEDSINKALDALNEMRKKKKHGSVAFSTIGQEKKFTHHQHCIQSIAIRYSPNNDLEYTVFYRQAECIKIFTGDMVFLRDIIMPVFGKGKATFFFSTAVLNAMYCPIMFIYYQDEWLDLLRYLYKCDKAFYKRIYKWCQMYFSEEPINYSSAEVIRELIHKHLDKKTRKKILNEFKKR